MADRVETLAVSEIYGPVHQGEGPTAGKPTVFLRLALCNFDCTWCDTPYTWDWTRYDKDVEVKTTSIDLVRQSLRDVTPQNRMVGLTVTGGEPMIQQRNLATLLTGVRKWYGWTEVETNGSIAPTRQMQQVVDRWSLSVKLANSGVPEDKRLKGADDWRSILRDPKVDAVLKPVVEHPDELDEVEAIMRAFGLTPHQVWVMPQAVDPYTLTERHQMLTDPVSRRGFNMTSRLQVLAFPGERAR